MTRKTRGLIRLSVVLTGIWAALAIWCAQPVYDELRQKRADLVSAEEDFRFKAKMIKEEPPLPPVPAIGAPGWQAAFDAHTERSDTEHAILSQLWGAQGHVKSAHLKVIAFWEKWIVGLILLLGAPMLIAWVVIGFGREARSSKETA